MNYQVVPSIKWVNGKVKEGFRVVGTNTSAGIFTTIAQARAFIDSVGGCRVGRVKRNVEPPLSPGSVIPVDDLNEQCEEWIKERFM